MPGSIVIIKNGDDAPGAKGNVRNTWKDGEIVGVFPADVALGNKMQVETGKFMWLNITDRAPETLAYLEEPWLFSLSYSELAGGARLRFTLENPSGNSAANYDQTLVEDWLLRATGSSLFPLDPNTVLAVDNVLNTTFTIDVTYAGADTPSQVANAIINVAAKDMVNQRKWTISTAGLTAIRNSDYVWSDGSGTTGGRLDDVFTAVSAYLVDKTGA